MTTKRKKMITTDRTFGIQNPIKDSQYGNVFRMSRDSIELYKSQLYTLIFTNKGERVMLPEFGTRIQELLFNPLTENIYDSLKLEIKNAAARWVPGVIIQDVIFEDSDSNLENNKIVLTIKFSLVVDQSIEDYIQVEKSI